MMLPQQHRKDPNLLAGTTNIINVMDLLSEMFCCRLNHVRYPVHGKNPVSPILDDFKLRLYFCIFIYKTFFNILRLVQYLVFQS